MIEEGGGFKLFQLPCGFTPTGLVHHSITSTVYIVGNEVCIEITIHQLSSCGFHSTCTSIIYSRYGCQWMGD